MPFDPSTAIAVDEVKPSSFDPSTATPIAQPKPGYEPYKANMADVGISGGEFENAQPVVLPEFGEPNTVTRGLSRGLSGAVEFATSTPGVAMAPAFLIPGVGPALGVGMSAYALWESAKKATEAIEKKSPEAAGEAIFSGALGLLGAAGGAKGITESAKVLPRTTAEAIKNIVPPGEVTKPEIPVDLLSGIETERAPAKITQLQIEKQPEVVLPAIEEAKVELAKEPVPVAAPEPVAPPEPTPPVTQEPALAPQPAPSGGIEVTKAAAPVVEPTPPPVPVESTIVTPPIVPQAQPPVIDPSFQPTVLATEASKVEGITPSPVAPLDIGDKLSSAMRRWFTVAGHLPQEVHEAAVKMGNLRTASDFRIKMQERDLRNALREVYGLSRLQMAGGGLRRIPSGAVQLMDDYMHGRVANPTIIPPQVRSVLDTMRAEIDAQSIQIVTELTRQANQLPPTSAKAKSLHELINKIKDNMDVYVHRSYKFFDSSKGAPEWYKKLNAGVRIKAEDYIMQNGPPGMTQAEAQSKILDWLSDLKGDTSFTGGGGTLGAKDLSIFMKRGVIAPELRAVLGEYHDPVINYAKSVSKMADWVAKQRFLNEVRRIGMGRFLFEEGANPPGFNTQIAGEGSNVMSPLNGLRTSEEIALAFHDLQSTPATGWWRGYLVLNALSKFAVTGQSMLTQMRNLGSRPLMALMAGHTQLGKLGFSAKAIWQDFAGKDKTWRPYLNRAYELGVIGDTARSGELKAIVKDAALNDVNPNELYVWSIGRAIRKYGYQIPAEIYRLSDDFGNIFGFENEKAIQRKVHPTWTPEQIEVEAAKIMREVYPTYSETPRAIKEFRKAAIVDPFVTFRFQAIRTVFNALARSVYEMKSANPTERIVGSKRLAGSLAAITATLALKEMSKQIVGINNKQEEDLRLFQPDYSKNAQFMFTSKDDKGKLSYVNLSYLDPYSYVTDPINAIVSATRSDKPVHEALLGALGETLRPFVSEQMLLQSILEARNGKTDSGREIWNKTDSGWSIWLKSFYHVLNSLTPGTVQRIKRRIIPAIRNEQPRFGRKLEAAPEIAREFTGLAIESFDFRTGMAFRANEFTDLDREAESLFHKTVSRTQTTTPTDLLTSYQEADRRRFLIWQDMRKYFLAAVRQGVPVQEARQVMNTQGITKGDAMAISTGKYVPMPISEKTMKLAQERKRTLPLNELQQYQSSVFHKSLDEPVK